MSDHQPATAHGHRAARGPATHGPATHGPGHDHDEEALTELLDLDGEVLRDLLDEATAWIAAAAQPPVTHIIDLGAGTGTGTFALLRRFPGAHVTAVDLDASRLERLRARAHDLDLAGRVAVAAADLDQPWPDLGPADLVWASMALHHVADPAQALARIFGLLRPGGTLALAETTAQESFPRFLPEGAGIAGATPGLEDRVHRLLAPLLADQVPELGADWRTRLATAGFEVAAERVFAIALDPPLPAQTGRYAQLTLDRLRTALGDQLDPADQHALATLVASEGPDSLRHRADLTVRAIRPVWLARRP
jgi:SAM-dependent methyltransferase